MKFKKSLFFVLFLLLLTQCAEEAEEATPKGFFVTGQDPDIMVSGIDFDNTGGSLLFNHNGGIATDGTHLILADRTNNRILIWNELPEGNEEPDIVLGQKDFTSNDPGDGLDEMNWPIAVATADKKLVVADTWNDRILIWNSFPTENAQAPDVVLKTTQGRDFLSWPWAVWTNGEKLIVASTKTAQVLIWNTFPTQNDQQPDVVLANEDFGTPRSIASDGTHLLIGDHNSYDTFNPGNFFWNTFPTEDNQQYDFYVSSPVAMGESNAATVHGSWLSGSTLTDDGKLLGFTTEGLLIWNSFPESENDAPDLLIGGNSQGIGGAPQGYDLSLRQAGEMSSVAVAGNKVYLSLTNGNKIVVYNTIPADSSQKPDFAIGSPDINTNTLDTYGFVTNGVPATDGEHLFASSDFSTKLYIWKKSPEKSGVVPDVVISLDGGPLDNGVYDDTLVLAGHQYVAVWEGVPLEEKDPDIVFNGNIGSVQFQDLKGVALDENYLYLADGTANKIYMWKGIPDPDEEPLFSLDVEQPGRLSSDGDYLVVSAFNPSDHTIEVFRVTDLSATSEPISIGTASDLFDFPAGVVVSGGELFVADQNENKISIWNDIEDAIAGEDPTAVLGQGGETPMIGKENLFWPAALAYDGEHLWVGEFKFSNRIIRYSSQ